MDTARILRESSKLLVVIDLIGTVPVFLYSTAGVPARLYDRIRAGSRRGSV